MGGPGSSEAGLFIHPSAIQPFDKRVCTEYPLGVVAERRAKEATSQEPEDFREEGSARQHEIQLRGSAGNEWTTARWSQRVNTEPKPERGAGDSRCRHQVGRNKRDYRETRDKRVGSPLYTRSSLRTEICLLAAIYLQSESESVSFSVVSDSLRPHGL